ncbi:MAG: murein L,D-transpeptidase [Nitrospina sp.]|nr:MAG: murein L,D-transpeptidase [Nitrospina sp.]
MTPRKLRILNITEYNLLANKNPTGSYDRTTREHLYAIIKKLERPSFLLSRLEVKLHQKFLGASFSALEDKGKKVKFEIARYRLTSKIKYSIKLAALAVMVLLLSGWAVYHLVLSHETRKEVDLAYYAGLSRLGLVASEEVERMRQDLEVTSQDLVKTKKEKEELAQVVEQMIHNNKLAKNLKYIVKQIYNDPRTVYRRQKDHVALNFDGRTIARYSTQPEKWYLLGIIESGVLRVYYDNDILMEVETIFGRAGEETPLGEYEIKNKIYNPTWYKKERINGKWQVRAIPFGDPDHEIGHWWMGMKRLGPPVAGSYGIHGVNVGKSNEFFKKNFDWRNGSAGCPNIQAWYLHFLAQVVPKGTRVNIVAKDKRSAPASNTAA